MSIKDNIKSRQAANDAMSLLIDESKASGGRRFWDHLVTLMREMLGKDAFPVTEVARDQAKAMGDSEAKAFESEKIMFGKYARKFIRDVPFSYLYWLSGQNEFAIRLDRYIRSDRCYETAARKRDNAEIVVE